MLSESAIERIVINKKSNNFGSIPDIEKGEMLYFWEKNQRDIKKFWKSNQQSCHNKEDLNQNFRGAPQIFV